MVGAVVGPIFRSPMEGKLASELSAELLSTSVPFEAITVRHMNSELPVFGFGVVTHNINSSDFGLTPGKLLEFSGALDTLLSIV